VTIGAEPSPDANEGLHGVATRASAYSVGISLMSSAAAYGTNIILGRSSASTLGTYTLVTTVAMFWVTMLLFGGSNVVVHFASGRDDAYRRDFVTTYAALIAALLAVGLCLLALVPQIGELVFGVGARQVQMMPLAVIVVASALITVTIASAQARLEMFRSALGQGVTAITVAVVVASSALLGFLKAESLQVLLAGAWCAAAVIAVFVGGLSVGKLRVGLLGKSFWTYAIPFHLSTIAYFMTGNVDVIGAAHALNVGDLGVYRVAMVGRQLVQLGPAMMIAPAYSILRRCEVDGLKDQFVHLAVRYVRVATGLSVFAAGVLLAASALFIAVFGKGFSGSMLPLVTLVSASAVLFPVGAVAGAAVVARGRVWESLGINIASAVIGVPLAIWLAGRSGIVGLAVAGATVLLLTTAMSWALLDRAVVVQTLVTLGSAGVCIALLVGARLGLGSGYLGSGVVLALAGILPVVTRLIRRSELDSLVRGMSRSGQQ
jgi:O-antigen/teichoic acid export membrane protein